MSKGGPTLWIALHLPQLALQISHRGLLPDLPLVISDGALQRLLVICAWTIDPYYRHRHLPPVSRDG